MGTFAQMAHDNRNAAIKAVQDLYEAAATENRDLSPEETEQAERMEADIAAWSEKRDKALRAENYAVEAALARGETEERIEKATKSEAPKEHDLIRQALRAAANGQHFVYDLATDGGAGVPRPEFRALQSEGGSAVATEYSSKVIMYLRNAVPLFRPDIVTLIETPDGHPIVLPRLTADPNHGGTVTAQAGGINELDPTISSITLGAFKYGITNLYSRELADDAMFNVEDLLAKSSARELRIDVNAHLSTGTGTVQPQGIVPAATAGFTAGGTASGQASDTFFAAADLLDLWYSLPNDYRQGQASWMASTTAVAKMRKFRDANGQFIWDTSIVAGQPDRFNGAPVYENAAMAAVASISKSVIVGDLSAFHVRVTPLRVEASRDYKFNTDQLALRTIIRVDSNLPDAAAVRSLVSANT